MTVPVDSSDLYSSLGVTVPVTEFDNKRISLALDLVMIQSRCRLLVLSIAYEIVTLTLIVGISVTASVLFVLNPGVLGAVALLLAGVGLLMEVWEVSQNYEALQISRLIESELIEKLHGLDSAERQVPKTVRYHRTVGDFEGSAETVG